MPPNMHFFEKRVAEQVELGGLDDPGEPLVGFDDEKYRFSSIGVIKELNKDDEEPRDIESIGNCKMEKSMIRDLLNSMSHFHHIFSVDKGKTGSAQMYYQSIADLLMLLMPMLNDIIDSEVPSNEQLSRRLEELDTFVDDAKKFLEGWHPLMSKTYNLLQIEVVAEKIQESILVICRILSSFTLSAASVSNINCIRNHESVCKNHVSSVIREATKNQRESNFPSSETMVKIADCLSLSSSQELLMEAVALEKAKIEAGHEKNAEEVELIDDLIALVTYMHDCLVKIKQSQTDGRVPIPSDFCCPLSLEPMSDPVIVASGQTYERAFIRKWLDMGLTVCPKTRQNLAHTNLIPNFTVKELIANWCELNNVKLPDPVKSINSNQPSMLLAHVESLPTDAHLPVSPSAKALEPSMLAASVDQRLSNGSSLEAYPNQNVSSHLDPPRVSDGASVSSSTEPSDIENGSGKGLLKVSANNENGMTNLGSLGVNSAHLAPALVENDSSEVGLIDEQVEGHTRSTSMSSAVSSTDVQGEAGDVNEMSSDNTNDNRDASGEVTSKDPASSAPPRDSDIPTRLSDFRTRSQPLWRRQSERSFVPRITSSPLPESKSNMSEVEAQVKKLIEDLQNPSIEVKRSAAIELRHLSKHNMENRIMIASCGAIKFLVELLYSMDVRTQENAVTALLNLSINDNNKSAIANAGAIDPLIHVLKTGSPEAKENSAATLFSLSVIDENKARIGRSGAIHPLVELLGNGTPRGKKDAATALFNLSICHENKARIVQAGAVRHLVDLMDPAAGMVDKAVAVLSNLSTIPDGRTAIGQEGGIPVLVEVVELGSSRGKENAAAALLQLCTYSPRFSNMVLQEGVVPPLVALSQSGTARAKEKAQNLLSHFRNQRHGNPGRV
ncbi:U-box domain-containing protein 4 isoform X2 [Nymphaea colorata]|uniref:U-box domain-containing protein 4 isoform X2 n=1 Tax=Nymphaea colorata TaxID=210225 RepID=UPI00129E58F3|nr:U-box domain-containing protein 4 isoform X2 [Nymphaea colorata]